MTVHDTNLPPARPIHKSFRLTRPGVPAVLESLVRPALVLPEHEGRALLLAAARQDVACGGCFSAGPAGVQVWSGPWEGPGGSRGDAQHLGSVNWSYDTPAKHYITIYRVLATAAGVASGESTTTLLARVLRLTGLDGRGEVVTMVAPPARDPFKNTPPEAQPS